MEGEGREFLLAWGTQHSFKNSQARKEGVRTQSRDVRPHAFMSEEVMIMTSSEPGLTSLKAR